MIHTLLLIDASDKYSDVLIRSRDASRRRGRYIFVRTHGGWFEQLTRYEDPNFRLSLVPTPDDFGTLLERLWNVSSKRLKRPNDFFDMLPLVLGLDVISVALGKFREYVTRENGHESFRHYAGSVAMIQRDDAIAVALKAFVDECRADLVYLTHLRPYERLLAIVGHGIAIGTPSAYVDLLGILLKAENNATFDLEEIAEWIPPLLPARVGVTISLLGREIHARTLNDVIPRLRGDRIEWSACASG